MSLLAASMTDLGSPISLIALWIVLGTVFFTLVRKLRSDDELGVGRDL
jgi:hypothetical protein